MSNLQLQRGVMTADGKWFASVTEARDYLRTPLVQAALKKVAGGDANLATFLFDNEDEILNAFTVGTVARVTKSEKKKLERALAHIAEQGDLKAKFVTDNAAAILDSFRWPSVKRLSAEEKVAASLAALTVLADANAAKWILDNQADIEAAYEAGVEKRQAPAGNGLAEYQAAKAAGPEALAAYKAKKDAEKAAAKKAA
jgi:hypothetical protein